MFGRPVIRYGYRSPLREMERLQGEMNRIFSDAISYPEARSAPSYPAINVWTNEGNAIVTAEMPGMRADDIDISIEADRLTLSGNRRPVGLQEGEKYHRRERSFGESSRAFQLPFNVQVDKVEAIFDKGILHISLPRAQQDIPKKITVKTAQ